MFGYLPVKSCECLSFAGADYMDHVSQIRSLGEAFNGPNHHILIGESYGFDSNHVQKAAPGGFAVHAIARLQQPSEFQHHCSGHEYGL